MAQPGLVMFIRILLFVLLLLEPMSVSAKIYRLVPAAVQVNDSRQTTELYQWGDSPSIVAEIDGVRLLVSPRSDFFKQPWVGITYIIDNRQGTEGAVVINASSARMLTSDRELKRYTQIDQLAYLDKRKRSADFWGGISAGFAAMNAARASGRYDLSGTAQGIVTDQYGNRTNVESEYSGTILDRGESQRAATDAAIDSARATHDTIRSLDTYLTQVLEDSPERRDAPAGEESVRAFWVFELPKRKRAVTPVRLEVHAQGRDFVFDFELVR